MAIYFSQTDRFTDSNGDPIAGGSLYIGEFGQNPETNPINIYSNEGLTTAISNPVALDSYGRPSTDIFVGVDFSYRVDDADDVVKEGPKDRRLSSRTNFTSSDSVGIITLEEVSANKYNINEGWQSMPPNGVYKFKFPTTNTGAAVITIDSIDATEYSVTASGATLGSSYLIPNRVYELVWDGSSFDIINTVSKELVLGLHGTIINESYDLDVTASNSRYTPGYAGGAEFYVQFVNENSSGDATIDVNVSDGATASQIFNDVGVPANDGIMIGPLVYTSTSYIEAAQTSGNVQMSIHGVGYASGGYLTPVTHVGLVPSAGLNLFTTGSQGGIYKLILGNLHTSDLLTRALITTSPKIYLSAVRQSLPVNDFLSVPQAKIAGGEIVRVVQDVSMNNVIACLATGWEV